MTNPAIISYLDEKKRIIENNLLLILGPPEIYPATLYESMHYSLLAGGKRIRPVLAIAACEAVNGKAESAIPIAVAIEMIHTYSLIHDDLPSMDNDDLRRGKPTNHKVFGESTAILSGDALLTHAFTVISDRLLWLDTPAERVLRIIHEIGLGAGPLGMVGGQQIDIESEGNNLKLSNLERLHRMKTGALIRVAVRAGGVAGGGTEDQLTALTTYAEKIGLAFQIADDILDVEGTPEETGKATGKDSRQNKNTYPALLGLEESKTLEHKLITEAVDALKGFDEKAEPLRDIARFIVERKK
ncbi:MAG: polyprenyl synthetase family protein [Nitrospirae bacterium]|nr:polyprenyl synthetase family protein [Nitrospirota bacterium]